MEDKIGCDMMRPARRWRGRGGEGRKRVWGGEGGCGALEESVFGHMRLRGLA